MFISVTTIPRQVPCVWWRVRLCVCAREPCLKRECVGVLSPDAVNWQTVSCLRALKRLWAEPAGGGEEGRAAHSFTFTANNSLPPSPFFFDSINCAVWVYSTAPHRHSDTAPSFFHGERKYKSVTFVFGMTFSEGLDIVCFTLWNWKNNSC